MKAVRIHHFGGSDQMKVENIPQPQVNDDQILVDVYDAGVNPIDWKVRQNFYRSESESDLPMTLGTDFAGVIVKAGANVQGLKTGDRVFGFALDGSYAEYAVTDANSCAIIPENVTFEVAAALPIAGLTAWQCVVDAAKISRGQNVLIQGAAGGVGAIAVQLCKWVGATIYATAAHEDFDYLRSVGADVLIDYKSEKFEQRVRDLDAVIDLVGGPVTSRSLQVLKPGGIIVSTTHSIKENEAREHDVRGVNIVMQHNSEGLAELVRLVSEGVIKPRLSRVLPLERAREAQDLNQQGRSHGKLVLEVHGLT